MKEKSKISITVPPGVDSGSRLRLRGQGNAGVEGGPSGDLFIVIELIPHPTFRREGKDIRSNVTISYPQATLGAKIDVETLWGQEVVSIPAGTQPGEIFRLRGKGIINVHRGGGKGDHLAAVTIDVPGKLTAKQRRALEVYAESLGSSRP